MSGQPEMKNGQEKESKNGQSVFASLTAGLMARKGEAAPAPAHLDGVPIHSHGVAREPTHSAVPDFLPPRDMSHPDEPTAAARQAQRHHAIRRATVGMGDCCELSLPAAVLEPLPAGHKSTVTTRLDPERVRKLKILAARMGTSNQKVMLAALDYYLDYACEVLAAECPCLARSLREDL